jgi:anti-sigma factor (TIGR02949 family)
MGCGCNDCEAMMQPYMDGMLSDEEVAEAKEHLDACPPCDKRYRFEERLRHFVRVASHEPMTEELRARLHGMRSTQPPA